MVLFYVYFWLRDNGTPYYVGKGKLVRRAYEKQGHTCAPPTDKDRIIIQYYESESEAFEAEKFFIVFYGRYNLRTGCLRNLTDGGEGQSGRVLSAEARRRIGNTRKERSIKPWNARIKTGQKVWNAGAKGVQIAWNKGKSITETQRAIIKLRKRNERGMFV